jgi:hypothetical protein
MKLTSILMVAALVGTPIASARNVSWQAETQETKPWSRWWWPGNAVSKPDLNILLGKYAEAGLGGLEITPIYGVHGYEDRFIDFLSDDWVDMFTYTLDKAKENNIGIDLANASGWPFGGSWVTEEDACKRLAYKTYHVKGGEKLDSTITYHEPGFVRFAGHKRVKLEDIKRPLVLNDLQDLALDQVRYNEDLKLVAVIAYSDKGEYIDLTDKVDADNRLNWRPKKDDWTLYALFEGLHGKLVERAGPNGVGNVINHFSEKALDNYLSKFDEAFAGKDISYLRYYFNDSYEVDDAKGESNWTPGFFDEFQQRRGYDLRKYLPQLLDGDTSDLSNKLRYDYRMTINDLLLEKYSMRWQRWAARQGKGIRNQAHGSPANILDLYSVSDVPEIEGEDLLSLKTAPSAGHIEGKRLISSESATWLKEHFRSNLGDVKKALDLFFLAGVNHVFYHGTCYSPSDAQWPGWLFYAAVHFNPNNTLWGDFKYLNKYVSRVQSYLQAGAPDNDVLLYYNITDVMSEKSTKTLQHFSGLDRNMAKSDVRRCAEMLYNSGYAYDLISDRQICESTLRDGQIVTKGASYKLIIVPGTEYIPYSTFCKLIEMQQAGAKVVFFGKFPEKLAGMATDEQGEYFNAHRNDFALTTDLTGLDSRYGVSREAMYDMGLRCIRRASATGKYYFIENNSGKVISDMIPLAADAQYAAIFNPMTGEAGSAKSDAHAVYLTLNPGESLIVETSDEAFDGDSYTFYQDSETQIALNAKWHIDFISGGAELPASLTVDTLGSWTEYGDSYSIFSGTAAYTTTVKKFKHKTDMVRLNLGDLAESARVYLNSEYIGTIINRPFELTIPANKFKGNDTLRIEVTNSMANRIIDLDKRGVEWKKAYNINMSAKNRSNLKDGIFSAADWQPVASGLYGPVTLTLVNSTK